MKFLLDTHSLIWFFSGHPNLSDTARKLIEDIEQQKLICWVYNCVSFFFDYVTFHHLYYHIWLKSIFPLKSNLVNYFSFKSDIMLKLIM